MAAAEDARRPPQRLHRSIPDGRESPDGRRNRCSPRQTYNGGRSATGYAREHSRSERPVRSRRFARAPRGSRARRDRYCRGLAPTLPPPSDPRTTRSPGHRRSPRRILALKHDRERRRGRPNRAGDPPGGRREARPNRTRSPEKRMPTGTHEARRKGGTDRPTRSRHPKPNRPTEPPRTTGGDE